MADPIQLQMPNTQQPQQQTQSLPQQPQRALVIGDTFQAPIHTDGFYSIRMIDDTVRIATFSYVAAAEEQPKPVITGVLTMSLSTFLKSFAMMEDYIKNLEKAGVIKKQ